MQDDDDGEDKEARAVGEALHPVERHGQHEHCDEEVGRHDTHVELIEHGLGGTLDRLMHIPGPKNLNHQTPSQVQRVERQEGGLGVMRSEPEVEQAEQVDARHGHAHPTDRFEVAVDAAVVHQTHEEGTADAERELQEPQKNVEGAAFRLVHVAVHVVRL